MCQGCHRRIQYDKLNKANSLLYIVDGVEYKLFTFDKNKTAYGDIQLIAPDEVGLYEVIALKILNPFEKIQVGTWCDVKTSVRFTLKVID